MTANKNNTEAENRTWRPRNIKGASVFEYTVLSAAMTATVLVTAEFMGYGVRDMLETQAWAVEEPVLMQTGYVSEHADKKVVGIAKDYQGSVTFIFEEAGYRNALGMYRFDESGAITDIEIIFANASAQGSGGDLVSGESSVDVMLRQQDQIGFFVASNAHRRNNPEYLETGTYELLDENGNPATIDSTGLLTLWREDPDTGMRVPVRTQYARNLFYSHGDPDKDYAPNADNYPHTVGHVRKEDGLVTLGFEDLYSGGDKDYDDIILEFDIGKSNAAVLDPNLNYEFYDDYDSWVQKMKLWEDSGN